MAGHYDDGSGKRGRAEYPDEFKCNDCQIDFKKQYKTAREAATTPNERRELQLAIMAPINFMVQGSLWAWGTRQIPRMDSKGTLCLECLEKRLRRPLHPADFTYYPVNLENPILQERRLLECLVIN